jgi:hypothetical protein
LIFIVRINAKKAYFLVYFNYHILNNFPIEAPAEVIVPARMAESRRPERRVLAGSLGHFAAKPKKQLLVNELAVVGFRFVYYRFFLSEGYIFVF